MALKAAEIAALKDNIPARFQPTATAQGELPVFFGTVAERGSATPTLKGSPISGYGNTNADELERLNLGLNSLVTGDANSGVMLSGALTVMRTAEIAKTAERKREDQRRLVLDQLMAQLNARLAELNAELAQIDERLDEIRCRRIELGDNLEALDDLEQLHASGTLDPDNPAHARLLRCAGITPDNVRGHDMHDIIAERRHGMSREDETLESEWNESMKRRAEVVHEREEVKTARAEIEGADTPDAMERVEQRARSVLGAQQLGEAAFQTERHKAEVIAADAVAGSESQDMRAQSYVYNSRAIEVQAETMFDSEGGDFELAAGPSKPSPSLPV